MKKQLTNNKLAFNKTAVTELNISELQQINGGSSGFVCDAVADAVDVIKDVINNVTRPIISN